MRNKLILLIFFVLVFSSYVYAADIQGRTIDSETGDEVPFVTIRVKDGDRIITGSIASEDGSFIVTGLEEKNYNLIFSSVGYIESSISVRVPTTSLRVELRGDIIELEEMIVEAVRYVYPSFNVFDERGNPVDGATVSIANDDFSYETVSSISGNYILSFVEPGDYRLTVSKRGFETKTRDIFLSGDFQLIEVTLDRLPEIVTEEQIFTPTPCGNNYDYILFERGDLISDRYLYSEFQYTDYYPVDGTERADRYDVYLFRPSYFGDRPPVTVLATNIELLFYRYGGNNYCGKEYIGVRNGQCTKYEFRRDEGTVTFEICPQVTTETTTEEEQLITTAECFDNSDCSSSRPICDFSGICIQEQQESECWDSNSPSILSTDEGIIGENPAQKLGGYCYINGEEKLDRVIDASSIGYYKCDNNCQKEYTYTCPYGTTTKAVDEKEVGACRVSSIEEQPTEPPESEILTEPQLIEKFVTSCPPDSLDDYEISLGPEDNTYEIALKTPTRVSAGETLVYDQSKEIEVIVEDPSKLIVTIDEEAATIDFYALSTDDVKVTLFECDSTNCEVENLIVDSRSCDQTAMQGSTTSAIMSMTGHSIMPISCTRQQRDLYLELANAGKIHNRMKLLDTNIGSKLMTLLDYGNIDASSISSSTTSGTYQTSSPQFKNMEMIALTHSDMSEIPEGIILQYFIAPRSTTAWASRENYYIESNQGKNKYIKLHREDYLVPVNYRMVGSTGYVEDGTTCEGTGLLAKDCRILNLLTVYDNFAGIRIIPSFYRSHPAVDVEMNFGENVNFLTTEQAGTYKLAPERGLYYKHRGHGYYFIKHQFGGGFSPGTWYAIPVASVTEPGTPLDTTIWTYDIEAMRRIDERLEGDIPQRTERWAVVKTREVIDFIIGIPGYLDPTD